MDIYSKNEKRTYIIGHVNPDADSIISAYAYAHLKQVLGNPNCRAARAGSANAQTEYIFERFGVPLPQLLPDLIPKVKYYASPIVKTIEKDKSLWDALQLMTDSGLNLLPVVDKKGRYEALLYYESFAHYILGKASFDSKATVHTSPWLIKQTLNAQELFLRGDVRECDTFSVLVGAAYSATVRETVTHMNPASLVVVLGDRYDLQRFVIEHKVRLLIITNGSLLSDELCLLAEENEVSVLVSPYDAATTSMMLLYSAPVQAAAEAVESVGLDVPVKRIKSRMLASSPRALPVVGHDGKTLCGIIGESDLMKEPNINVILVDHNELSQSVEGIEHYKILEVIDHHRLGGFRTSEPINFINKVVGSTSAIIASLYREHRVPIPREIAALLLCGIISDTIGLKSVTATDFDRQTARDLATIAHLDFENLVTDLANAANQIGGKTPRDLILMDQKIYEREGRRYMVSQIETSDVSTFLKEREAYLNELTKEVAEKSAYFASLMVTDLSKLSSYLFIEGDKDFIQMLSYPEQETHVYFMKGVLSRKKQLIPLFSEIFAALEE
jgi:manganese-dependent inorganic pyrophosphatase